MIVVDKVTKTYGKNESQFTALQGISLQVEDGETLAIVGKSGSGKSTLMHIMSGLDHPSSGRIVIDGKELGKMKPKAMDSFRSQTMSFIFQSFFVEANQTCFQNVMLPLEISKVPRGRRTRMVLDALRAVDLEDKVKARAANLSGGQKQRLAIARAIVNKPGILFADEPTGNLDSVTGAKIIELLFNLNKELGCTVIIVTHDQELANKCQRSIRLKDGKVVKQ